MNVIRTPDERFENLPGFAFEPHYLQVPDAKFDSLRMHYVDEGPRDTGETFVLLHGVAKDVQAALHRLLGFEVAVCLVERSAAHDVGDQNRAMANSGRGTLRHEYLQDRPSKTCGPSC